MGDDSTIAAKVVPIRKPSPEIASEDRLVLGEAKLGGNGDAAAQLAAYVEQLATATKAPATRRAYQSDWNVFISFCSKFEVESLPAASPTVAAFAAHSLQEGCSPSTIQRRCSAISEKHRSNGFASPVAGDLVRKVLVGIRRTDDRVPDKKKALRAEELRRMIAALDESGQGRRDTALLLVGFVGALRRSELVDLNWSDIEEHSKGYTLRIRRSKTDQEGEGRTVVAPYSSDKRMCPVNALRRWNEISTDGPIFCRVRRGGRVTDDRLSGQSVNLIVKRCAGLAELAEPDRYGAHSLRAGFATEAAAKGASERAIANQTGHRSMRTLRGYIQQATPFEDNAALELGL